MVRYLISMLPILLESFPVSSSGHALLLLNLFGKHDSMTCIPEYFDHVLHGPIACIIALFFFKRWSFLLVNFRRTWHYVIKIVWYGVITETITIVWYLFYLMIKLHAQHYLSVGFLVTAGLLFSLNYCPANNEKKKYSIVDASMLGMAQGFALLPGVSRFGATFVCARWLGFSDKKSFELSFLIEWPISVAGFLKGLYSIHAHKQLDLLNSKLLLAMLFASIGALIGFYCVSQIINNKKLWLFSPYVAGIGILAAFFNR